MPEGSSINVLLSRPDDLYADALCCLLELSVYRGRAILGQRDLTRIEPDLRIGLSGEELLPEHVCAKLLGRPDRDRLRGRALITVAP